ncbi:isopentenyl phosphate kinase family protein [Nostoc sp. LEGE 06077]|uniref:isopentenyl phosphate kinase n=1 Tax=Nostoc sp. LEGE 06077 TaxID=915325 RepID=UPI00187FE5FF|nr:isopentenyl phosphate kinase [Nostoc sp. LEGE 06077]MBE9206301.1 isopentenyl phosphate kinase family protein [Nostoc sp. LEGE 06077]
MLELVLIKLGGSLITDKNQPYTARLETMQKLVEQISLVRKYHPSLKLIVGNGAGSFGHQSAHKYNTINGIACDAEKLGFCLVHQDVLDLNILLAKCFLQAGLSVVSLPPLTMVVTDNKKLLKTNFSVIENSLQAGLIPLVFGDVVLDQKIGGTILSTDTLLAELAKYFHIQGNYQVKLINAGNYPGVYNQYGQVIPQITPANYFQIKAFIGKSESVDVTGGMTQKVEEFLAISSLGIDCWIIDGNISGNLVKAVLGQPTLGTVIRAL